jgi:hypothetical protein
MYLKNPVFSLLNWAKLSGYSNKASNFRLLYGVSF